MTIHLAPPPDSPAFSRDLFLPIIGGPPLPPEPEPPATESAEAAFAHLLTTDPRQERPQLTRCPSLVLAAVWRAKGLSSGDPWAHVDAAGVTPNEYCRQAGCRLPHYYASKGNNVENLAAGSADAAVIFAALANSPKHADLLFGRGWFRHQTHFGVALAEGGELGWYWCVLCAACEGVMSGE